MVTLVRPNIRPDRVREEYWRFPGVDGRTAHLRLAAQHRVATAHGDRMLFKHRVAQRFALAPKNFDALLVFLKGQ